MTNFSDWCPKWLYCWWLTRVFCAFFWDCENFCVVGGTSTTSALKTLSMKVSWKENPFESFIRVLCGIRFKNSPKWEMHECSIKFSSTKNPFQSELFCNIWPTIKVNTEHFQNNDLEFKSIIYVIKSP